MMAVVALVLAAVAGAVAICWLCGPPPCPCCRNPVEVRFARRAGATWWAATWSCPACRIGGELGGGDS